MKRKAIIAAALLFAGAVSAFADVGMYIKGALGYDFFGYGGFEIRPTFGISPWMYNDSAFLENLSFEAIVDLSFGSGVTAISPGLMAVYNWQMTPKFSMRYGLGVSVPIIIFGNDYDGRRSLAGTTRTGFGADAIIGFGFAATDKIMPVLEFNFTYNTIYIINMAARVGVMYKFGGGSKGGSTRGSGGGSGRNGSSTSQIAPQDLPPAPEDFSYFGTWRNTSNPSETLIVYPDGLAILQIEGEEPVVGSYRVNEERMMGGYRLRFKLAGMKNTDLRFVNALPGQTDRAAMYRYGGMTVNMAAPLYTR